MENEYRKKTEFESTYNKFYRKKNQFLAKIDKKTFTRIQFML